MKLKTEFRDLCSTFMKVLSNIRNAGMGDNDQPILDEQLRVYSRDFIEFCRGDMCVHYLYCCATKYGLMDSRIVTMPAVAFQEGSTSSKIHRAQKPNQRGDAKRDRIGAALEAPLQIY